MDPTIDSFEYDETVTFSRIGKPFLVYAQRTRHADDGRQLHAETAIWRVPCAGHVDLVLAHPNGIVEVSEGTIKDARPYCGRRSSTVQVRPTEVTAVERDFTFGGQTHFPT